MPTLRPASPEDMPSVAEVWHRAWHDAHPGHVPDGLTAARTLASFRERVPHRVADTVVGEVDGTVAGFVMVAGDEVEQVFVDARHRGSGLAGLLLDAAERLVAEQGHEEAWLAVVTGNGRARAFYERRGWTDGGDLPYAVTAGGQRFVSPCRRYTKRVAPSQRSGPAT